MNQESLNLSAWTGIDASKHIEQKKSQKEGGIKNHERTRNPYKTV
jgi:hypothetical protein